ncbi:HEAT repeat-containing protein, partial [Toxoplasma gondii VAND]
ANVRQRPRPCGARELSSRSGQHARRTGSRARRLL